MKKTPLKTPTDCTITIRGTRAIITGDYPIQVVRDATSYWVDGYRFSKAYKSRRWDGKKHFFSLTTSSLPAGLVEMVCEALLECCKDAKVNVVDERDKAAPAIAEAGFELHGIEFGKGKYDYQLHAAKAMVEKKQCILKVATNGGKSCIAAAVIKYLGLPTVFLVERLELIYQTRKRFAEMLQLPIDDIGLVGDSKFSIGDWITIATPASLKPVLKHQPELKSFWQVSISDECQHVSSDTHYDVLTNLTTFYRYAMSGTPLDRTDGTDMKLIAQTGPVAYDVPNKLLVERGISVQPYVEMVKIDKPVLPKKGLNWPQVEKLGIIENDVLNSCVVNKALEHAAEGKQVLVLVEKIKHGKELHMKLCEGLKGASCCFISGKETTDVRGDALDRYKAGVLRVLVATTILDEGVDVPCIDVLILASGGKAKIRLLQRVGRGLRSGDGKERLTVIDFANFTHKWLLQHSLARFNTYKQEECFMISAS